MTASSILLSLLELIVLILTAIIISLQFTSVFYSRIDHQEREDIQSYIPVEMIFVGVSFFGVSAIAIVIYLTVETFPDLTWLERIGFGSIMLTFGLGVILFGTAILSVINDMMDTSFGRDNENQS